MSTSAGTLGDDRGGLDGLDLGQVAPWGKPTTEHTGIRSPATSTAKRTIAGCTHTDAHPKATPLGGHLLDLGPRLPRDGATVWSTSGGQRGPVAGGPVIRRRPRPAHGSPA